MSKQTPLPSYLHKALKQIQLPQAQSHKGQNGKLLIIGGSQLFHAASKWSLDIASKFVDMVFYASIPSNNQLITEAKSKFWNGIVINRSDLANYIDEADVILIGPGMERTKETQDLVNNLLTTYANKKWVIDAGALQMLDPQLLTNKCIITPHHSEMELLKNKDFSLKTDNSSKQKPTVLLKGPVDQIFYQNQQFKIKGGNAGMTKGGTGDVLAGLVAALYCSHQALTSCLVASYINKSAGDFLYQTVGPFFNASDLVKTIPQVFWQKLKAV